MPPCLNMDLCLCLQRSPSGHEILLPPSDLVSYASDSE